MPECEPLATYRVPAHTFGIVPCAHTGPTMKDKEAAVRAKVCAWAESGCYPSPCVLRCWDLRGVGPLRLKSNLGAVVLKRFAFKSNIGAVVWTDQETH